MPKNKFLFLLAPLILLIASKSKASEKMSEFWIQDKVKNGLKYKPFFDAAEKKYAIPNNILAKMGWRESRFRDDVVNGTTKGSVGETGIMQITPRWHPGVNYTDPMSAIDYAGKYLSDQYKKFGDWKLAVMAYNWGPGNVIKWIDAATNQGFNRDPSVVPTVTKGYITEVFGAF